MRRREFITLVGSAAASSCAWPFAASAQVPTKRPRITYIAGSGPMPSAKVTGAFIEGMRALGYTEGRDFEMEYRWAEGYLERLPAFAEESVRRGSDVIVAANPQAAVAAKDATKTIPIVGVLLDDPVGLGLIKSDAKPGGNVHCMNGPQPEGRMASYIARRKFLATLGGVVAWPLAARAQQPAMRVIEEKLHVTERHSPVAGREADRVGSGCNWVGRV
jgi:ABC-type uncharacterized transport system substrate-binding protein